MSREQIAASVAGILFALFLVHGTVRFYLLQGELNNLGRIRAEHQLAMNAMRDIVAAKDRELLAAGREAAALRERVNTLVAESREMPDAAFLAGLAGKLLGIARLDDDPLLVELYRGRPAIVEGLPVAGYHIRAADGLTVLRFSPEGTVGRAEFRRETPGNDGLKLLDRKKTMRVSFIGRIHDFGGQFEFHDARLLAIGE